MITNNPEPRKQAKTQAARRYVKFGSHRAREYGFRALNREPQGFFSLDRKTGPGGTYLVSDAEIAKMRRYSKHARFTILRSPYNDLMECWTL